MQLSDEEVQEFIELYRKETGKTLSLKEAREAASNLLELYLLLSRPLPGERKKRKKGSAGDGKK